MNLYPEDWFKSETIHGLFQVDQNAPKRAVAEEVFKVAFEKLRGEQVADLVAKAFLRRSSKYGTDDNGINCANMSTALLIAIIEIRDNIK